MRSRQPWIGDPAPAEQPDKEDGVPPIPQTTPPIDAPRRSRLPRSSCPLAALVVVRRRVSSPSRVAAAPAAPRRGQLGPVARRATSPTRASCTSGNGTYYAFATQSFAAASQTINIQVSISTDGVKWTPAERRRRAAHPPVVGRAGQHLGTQRRLRRATTSSSCTTRRPRPSPATSASAWPPRRHRSAPTPTPSALRSSARTATTPVGTVDNGNYGGSIDPDIFTDDVGDVLAHLEERRQPHRPGRDTTSGPLRSTPDLLPATGGRPGQLLTDDAAVAERHHRGPRHVSRRPERQRQAPTTSSTRAATRGRRPTPSVGPAARAARRRLHRRTDVEPAPDDLGPGMSGPGGPDVYTAARRDSSSWPSPPGRGPRSATSRAASGPCTWPISPSAPAATRRSPP